MEKLAKALASKIASSTGCDDEREKVIAYGLLAIIQFIITVAALLSLGLLTGASAEALTVCFSASILRKYSGGAHAAAAWLCTCIGLVYCTLTAFISRQLLSVYNPICMAVAGLIVYLLSYWLIYKLAPVDSPNKPIRTEKKKRRMRRCSFIVISVYFILSGALFFLGFQYKTANSLGISLLFGISWQVLTLTTYGFSLLGKINQFFIRKEV